jgi:CubicO group peptidase (beta-lactamase class C family)
MSIVVASLLLSMVLLRSAWAQDPVPHEERPLLIAETPALPPPPDDDAERMARFRDGFTMDEFLRRSVPHGFSGAVLAFRGQDLLLRAGYGLRDRASGTPVTPDTRFDVGPIAQSFTAAAVLRLAETGRLDLDGPVRRVLEYVPEGFDGVTPRLLLRHATGVSPDPDVSALPDLSDAESVVLSAMASIDPERIGGGFIYRDANYNVLAALVEGASGLSFQTAMRELVFDRAGLSRTGLVGDGLDAGPVAIGYADPPGRRPRADGMAADAGPFDWTRRGATGVVTTVTELYRWCRALETSAVLARSSREAMFTPGDGEWGLGWFVRYRPAPDVYRLVHEHGGTTRGFQSHLSFWPDEPAVLAIAANTSNGSVDLIRPMLERIMWGGLVRLPPKAAEPPLTREQLARFEGRYATGEGVLVIRFNEDLERLTIHAEGQDAVDVLVAVDGVDRDRLRRRHEIAAEVLEAFKRRDPIPALAYAHELVPERAAENWILRWASVEGGAQLESVEVLGTAPGELGPLTFARLTYAEGRGPEVVRILWVDDRIGGISRARLDGPGALVLVGESEEFLAGFDPRTWDTTRLFLPRGSGDAVLTINGPTGDHRAVRLPPPP